MKQGDEQLHHGRTGGTDVEKEHDDDSDQELGRGYEPMDIRGGGDDILQVEEENKLKRKWVQTFITENDKEEDEFDQMMNGYPM